jgi:hypothetical protein
MGRNRSCRWKPYRCRIYCRLLLYENFNHFYWNSRESNNYYYWLIKTFVPGLTSSRKLNRTSGLRFVDFRIAVLFSALVCFALPRARIGKPYPPFLLTEADACLRLQLDNFSDDNTILQAGGDTNPLDFASATLVLTFSSWESIVVFI